MEKSLFGGYKKATTDSIIKRLTEDDEHAQTRIALLENELHISKENVEALKKELETKQMVASELTRLLETKNQKIAEIEEKYQKISQLNKNYNDQTQTIRQLYVNVQEYLKTKKEESKTEILDISNSVFEKMRESQKHFESSLAQISSKKDSLRQQMGALAEAFQNLQQQIDNIESNEVDISAHFEQLESLQTKIQDEIVSRYDEAEEADALKKEIDGLGKKLSLQKKTDSRLQVKETEQNGEETSSPLLNERERVQAEESAAESIAPIRARIKSSGVYKSGYSERESYGNFFSDIIDRFSKEEHSLRVAYLCQKMGEALALPKSKVEELKTVGLLHDIGKIAIEKNILNKKGRLTDNEWKEIKRHPEIGYRILSMIDGMSNIAEYVLFHHESWDGQGYPRGLKGEDIPLASRIIMIADAYDAMTSERNYKRTLSVKDAAEELQKNAAIQFDPELVTIFIEKVLKANSSVNRFQADI